MTRGALWFLYIIYSDLFEIFPHHHLHVLQDIPIRFSHVQQDICGCVSHKSHHSYFLSVQVDVCGCDSRLLPHGFY